MARVSGTWRAQGWTSVPETMIEVQAEPVALVGITDDDPVTHQVLNLEQMIHRLGVLDPAHGLEVTELGDQRGLKAYPE